MTTMLVDNVKAVAFHNGVLRIDCVAVGSNNEEQSSGTLLIPGNMVGPILQALVTASQDLDKQMREHAAKHASTAGNA